MTTYYNEFDPAAADWIEALIEDGLLPAGEVDRRSIADVEAQDLDGFAQHHFFAGIGGWPFALRLIGWPDDRPVWTGSCPCPPFSAAGKGSECPSCGGKANLAHPLVTAGWLCLSCGDEWRGDDRHLLPEFIRLIGQRRPPVVFGEQVASADGRAWFAALRAVMERVGYGAGAADLCAAGVGAPHIRQRLFFGLADRGKPRLEGHGGHGRGGDEPGRLGAHAAGSTAEGGDDGGLADRPRVGRREERALGRWRREGDGPEGRAAGHGAGGDSGRMADADHQGEGGRRIQRPRQGDDSGARPPLERSAGFRTDGRLADAHGGDSGAEREQRGREQRQQPQDGLSGRLADATGARHNRALTDTEGDPWDQARMLVLGSECADGRMADSGSARRRKNPRGTPSNEASHGRAGRQLIESNCDHQSCSARADERSRAHHSGWADPDWLYCRDGKWRPVESSVLGVADGIPDGVVSGSYPLAQAQTARQTRLRGFGNAIVPQLAAEFMTAFMESIDD